MVGCLDHSSRICDPTPNKLVLHWRAARSTANQRRDNLNRACSKPFYAARRFAKVSLAERKCAGHPAATARANTACSGDSCYRFERTAE